MACLHKLTLEPVNFSSHLRHSPLCAEIGFLRPDKILSRAKLYSRHLLVMPESQVGNHRQDNQDERPREINQVCAVAGLLDDRFSIAEDRRHFTALVKKIIELVRQLEKFEHRETPNLSGNQAASVPLAW